MVFYSVATEQLCLNGICNSPSSSYSIVWRATCWKNKKVKVDHTPERRVTELITVLGSQPAGDTSHKHGGWLPFLSTKPTVTLQRAATNFAAW